MFWSDMGAVDKIERAALSGTQRKVILKYNLDDPVGLTIDYATDRYIYIYISLGFIQDYTYLYRPYYTFHMCNIFGGNDVSFLLSCI